MWFCQEGEEDYLHAAASLLDREAEGLVATGARLTQERMLLMAGLMLADKTLSTEEDFKTLEKRLAQQAAVIDELQDRPAFKVAGNDLLLSMAQKFQDRDAKLGWEWPGRLRPDQRVRLEAAIARVGDLPEKEWPVRRRRGNGSPKIENESRYRELKAARDEVAEELGIEPTLLATRSVLEELSVYPERLERLLMGWQREVLFPRGIG